MTFLIVQLLNPFCSSLQRNKTYFCKNKVWVERMCNFKLVFKIPSDLTVPVPRIEYNVFKDSRKDKFHFVELSHQKYFSEVKESQSMRTYSYMGGLEKSVRLIGNKYDEPFECRNHKSLRLAHITGVLNQQFLYRNVLHVVYIKRFFLKRKSSASRFQPNLVGKLLFNWLCQFRSLNPNPAFIQKQKWK